MKPAFSCFLQIPFTTLAPHRRSALESNKGTSLKYTIYRQDRQLNQATKKPGTGGPLHTQEPVTVASFRTWRGWRERVARDRCLTDRF